MNKHILYGVMAMALGCTTVACTDDEVDINTAPIVSDIITGDAATTATTATIEAVARDLSSQSSDAYTVGVVYSTSSNPIAAGLAQTGVMGENGNFTTTITDLQEGRTYYYAAFVALQNRLYYYGDIKSFVTTSSRAGTAEAASVTPTSAMLGGTLNGVADLIAAGSLDYGVALAPEAGAIATTPVRIAAEGTTNSFTVAAEHLVPNTTYHYAAYMVVGGEEIFGNTQSFTTPALCDASQESPADYVDMGTRLEWCRYNVGAPAEGASGALIGYGDVKGLNRSLSVADYAAGDITSTPADVAAAAGMGFLPTVADFEELIAACDVAREQIAGTWCARFTSRSTGNTIYFPLDGAREEGENITAGELGLYATGQVYADQPDYTHALRLDGSTSSMELVSRASAISVRPVRKPFANVFEVDNSKLAVGCLENNGRIRIEIYNAFGSTASDPSLALSRLVFDNTMAVTFRLTGIDGNLREGAAGSYRAGLQYAAGGWDPSYWSAYDNNRFDCVVAGDGTYTVWMETQSPASGAEVFCVDIENLFNDLVDDSALKAEIVGIALDPAKPVMQTIPVDNSKVLFNNKDGNNVDGRIEIFNEYGDSKAAGADYSFMKFPAGTMTINFSIEGIDGNLRGGAAGSYRADLSFADADWYPSYWGGQIATASVTADGTYSVQAHISDQADGAVVWCVELYGLWQDLVDTSKVKVKINSVTVPAFAD